MTWTPPATTEEFKLRFDRDFPFGSGTDTVRDKDIERGIASARSLYNYRLFSDDDERKDAFLLLAAHFVWTIINGAGGLSAGLKGGLDQQGEGLTMSKGVGPASVSYSFPDRITKSPILSPLMRSSYGQQYLQIVSPRLVGAAAVVDGWSEFGFDEV